MFDLPRAEQWYSHEPEGATENKNIKVLWGFSINADYEIGTEDQILSSPLKQKKNP